MAQKYNTTQPNKRTYKLRIKTMRKLPIVQLNSITTLFPEKSMIKSRDIGFKFAGCSPVILKSKNKASNATAVFAADGATQIDQQLVNSFNKKIVVSSRPSMRKGLRLKRQCKHSSNYYDYRSLQF